MVLAENLAIVERDRMPGRPYRECYLPSASRETGAHSAHSAKRCW